MIADAASVPGPELVARLHTARQSTPRAIIDSRVLPGQTRAVVDEESRAGLAAAQPVSAECTLLDVAALRAVGELWSVDSGRGAVLEADAEAAGLRVLVEATATIFLPVGLDAEGQPVPGVAPRHI